MGHINRPTQKQRVLEMLQRQKWVCGTEFIRAYIPNFQRRVHSLRHANCCPKGPQTGCQIRDGYRIDKRHCDNEHHYHEVLNWQYTLVSQGQSVLF